MVSWFSSSWRYFYGHIEYKEAVAMSGKDDDSKFDSKRRSFDGKEDEDFGCKSDAPPAPPCTVTVSDLRIYPEGAVDISSPLDLEITFELDRDVVAAYWSIQFLVDAAHRRIIKKLGDTSAEDFPDGESEVTFHADTIDVSGIAPAALTNCGLLMAVLMVDGAEVASVNMVRGVHILCLLQRMMLLC